jgi:O-antigen/teichoic acid export membrane protein
MDSWTEKQRSSLIVIKTIFHKLLNWTMVDRAVLFAALAKGWGLCAGPVTVLLIASYFTPELQGYYYTFANIIVLQVFVELGLGTVLVQFTSHEWSRLRLDTTGQLVGDEEALSRLISIARVGAKWYLTGGIIVALGLSLGGYFFFSGSPSQNVSWFWPWLCLCLLAGMNICLVPVWSLLEGCNQVSQLFTYRFIQGVCCSFFVWIAILLGVGLWAATVNLGVSLICAAIFLVGHYRRFLKTLIWSQPLGPRISWYREILPMQWRIALSWVSGYLIFSLFTPILFKYHGPVVAGQMGMTWSLLSAMGIASAWLAPRVPKFGILIAQRKYEELEHLFWRITIIVVAISIFMALGIWFFVYVLYESGSQLATRLLPPFPTALFLIAQILVTISLPFSTYMRAHKTEPIAHLSVIAAVLNGISAITLGKYYAAYGMAWGYLFINIMIIPMVVLVWHRQRLEWYSTNSS